MRVPKGYLASGKPKHTATARAQGVLLLKGQKAMLQGEKVGGTASSYHATLLERRGTAWVLPDLVEWETVDTNGWTRISAEQNEQGEWVKLLVLPDSEFATGPAVNAISASGPGLEPGLEPGHHPKVCPEKRQLLRTLAQRVFEPMCNALSSTDVSFTRKPHRTSLNSPAWRAADLKGLLKVLGGERPIVDPQEVDRSELDMAVDLVMARTETVSPSGEVLECKTRVAADGRNETRDVDGSVRLPMQDLINGVFVAALSQKEIRVSDVVAAYPHADMDER